MNSEGPSASLKRPGQRELVIAAVAVNALSLAFMQLKWMGLVPMPMAMIPGFAFIAVNVAVGLLGLATSRRALWLIYLLTSLAGLLLFGMDTPASAAWAVLMLAAA